MGRLLGEGGRRLKALKQVVDDRGEDVEEPKDEGEVKDSREEKPPVKDFSPVAQESKDVDCYSHVYLCVFGNLWRRGCADRVMKQRGDENKRAVDILALLRCGV
jgi:hypothetical protein